jgi:hypothetical protein
VTFLSVSAGLFAGQFVYGLFYISIQNHEAIVKLFLKCLATAVLTGLVLGILNMFLKIGKEVADLV